MFCKVNLILKNLKNYKGIEFKYHNLERANKYSLAI